MLTFSLVPKTTCERVLEWLNEHGSQGSIRFLQAASHAAMKLLLLEESYGTRYVAFFRAVFMSSLQDCAYCCYFLELHSEFAGTASHERLTKAFLLRFMNFSIMQAG